MKKYLSVACTAIVISMSACSSEEKSTTTETVSEPEPAMSNGQKLFVNNCVQCHNVKTDKIGPKLEGSLARWDNDTSRLRAFIKNSQEVIKAGDPRAVKVYEEFNRTVMTPMPHLTNSEIDEILEYISTAK